MGGSLSWVNAYDGGPHEANFLKLDRDNTVRCKVTAPYYIACPGRGNCRLTICKKRVLITAQPLVRDSYKKPVYTYEVNVMGTVNILECVRNSGSVKSFLNVTTYAAFLITSPIGTTSSYTLPRSSLPRP